MMENIFFIKVSYYLQNSLFTNLTLKTISKTALKEHLPIEQGLRLVIRIVFALLARSKSIFLYLYNKD